MDIDTLRENWALVAALPLLTIVGLIVLRNLFQRSARGQLRANVARVARKRRASRKADAGVIKAERRLARMERREERTRPRLVQEAKDKVADAKAAQKVAQDQVLIAENHLRRIIHEEFPPRDQETLRKRHLPPEKPNTIPFSFEE